MAAQFDLVVRGGMVFDGTGRDPREADVAMRGAASSRSARVAGGGPRKSTPRGLAVTPGFVDIHTHYDGQVTWDDRFSPVVGPRRDDRADGQLRRRLPPCRPQDRES